MTNLKEELRELIAEIAEKDEVPDDVSFKDLGIDSMMGVEIVAAIERKYQVKIDDAELVEVTTLNNSMALVKKKLDSSMPSCALRLREAPFVGSTTNHCPPFSAEPWRVTKSMSGSSNRFKAKFCSRLRAFIPHIECLFCV